MLNQEQILFQKSINSYLNRKNHQSHEDISILQSVNIPKLPQVFCTSTKYGLTHEKAVQNEKKFGKNVYRKKKIKSYCQIFYGAITDQMLIILMIAAVISLVVQYFFGQDKDKFWIQGVSILVAVAICSIVGSFNDYQKNKQFAQLDQLSDKTFKYEVIRQGQNTQLHRSDIVAGDIIRIHSGMQIPTDSLLIQSIDVIVDESQLTGQSHQVYKNTFQKCLSHIKQKHCPNPLMISGTSVSSGQGKIMAVIVGQQSQMGKFFDLIFQKDDEDQQTKTPLQERLDILGTQIGKFGLYSAIVIFAILVIRLVIENVTGGGFEFGRDAGQIVSYLIISVAIVVVAVPQGLPLAVTLTLAYSVKQMYDENNLVKKLISCETMGSVHYICTDKTGTITQNKMYVVQFINEEFIQVQPNEKIKFNKNYAQLLTQAICHNTSSHTQPEKGSQTQIALLKFINQQFNINQTKIREKAQVSGYFKRLPFNSNRKRMTTGVVLDDKNYLFMSGASQVLIQACSSYLNSSTNKTCNLDKNKIYSQIYKMTKKGLRSVAIGYKIVKSMGQSHYQQRDVGQIQKIQRDGFTLLGVFGIEDKPRPESLKAIEECRNAGVNVIMVTGDNLNTAESIGKQVHIINDQFYKCLQGSQFQKMLKKKDMIIQEIKDYGQIKKKIRKMNLNSQEKICQFGEIVDNLAVLARSKPQHKYLLVDGLIQLNHVVAVTGDGTNDAPALVKADVGLSMGQSGTQIAKNASDIVILDDRFDSIVKSIVWGRNIYASIRKFLQFQLTVNLVAVILSVLSAAIIRQSVLTAVQMLWVNLIMDSLASLALSTQHPDAQTLLKLKPYSRDQSLLTSTMIKHVIGQTIFQVIILMILLFLGHEFLPEQKDAFDDIIGKDVEAKYYKGIEGGTMADGRFYTLAGDDAYKVYFDKFGVHSRHFTFIFNAFVLLQIFNFFCCRRISDQLNLVEGIFSTYLFWFIVLIIVVFQVIIIQFLSQFFSLYKYGLTTQQWLICIGIGILTVPVSIILRLIPFCKPLNQTQHEYHQFN